MSTIATSVPLSKLPRLMRGTASLHDPELVRKTAASLTPADIAESLGPVAAAEVIRDHAAAVARAASRRALEAERWNPGDKEGAQAALVEAERMRVEAQRQLAALRAPAEAVIAAHIRADQGVDEHRLARMVSELETALYAGGPAVANKLADFALEPAHHRELRRAREIVQAKIVAGVHDTAPMSAQIALEDAAKLLDPPELREAREVLTGIDRVIEEAPHVELDG